MGADAADSPVEVEESKAPAKKKRRTASGREDLAEEALDNPLYQWALTRRISKNGPTIQLGALNPSMGMSAKVAAAMSVDGRSAWAGGDRVVKPTRFEAMAVQAREQAALLAPVVAGSDLQAEPLCRRPVRHLMGEFEFCISLKAWERAQAAHIVCTPDKVGKRMGSDVHTPAFFPTIADAAWAYNACQGGVMCMDDRSDEIK